MSILIVVDVQKGFSEREDVLPKAKKIVELTNSNRFEHIIATRFINVNDSPFIKILHWDKLKDGDSTELVEGLKCEKVIIKHSYTCVSNELIDYMAELNGGTNPTEVYICGIDTDCCVLKTAVDLFEMGIRPIVLKDYCASNGGEVSHEAGIKVLERTIGIDQIK